MTNNWAWIGLALTSPFDSISWTNSFHDIYPLGWPLASPCFSRLADTKAMTMDSKNTVSIMRGFIGGGNGGCCWFCLLGSLPVNNQQQHWRVSRWSMSSPYRLLMNPGYRRDFLCHYRIPGDNSADHSWWMTSLECGESIIGINLSESLYGGILEYWEKMNAVHFWTMFEKATRERDEDKRSCL